MSYASPAIKVATRREPVASAYRSEPTTSTVSSAMDSSENTEPSSVLQRIAAGDSSAVDDCLEQYRGLVWSLANRYCRVSGDAEDAAQEIFVALWRSADRFDPTKASESTFVTMIARRRLIDRSRRRGSSPEVVSISDSEIEMADRDPTDQVELSDEAAKAARCMRHLSKNQRQILTLSIDRGEAQSAIAAALGMPLGTVKSYARRGILQLRECMKRPLEPETAS